MGILENLVKQKQKEIDSILFIKSSSPHDDYEVLQPFDREVSYPVQSLFYEGNDYLTEALRLITNIDQRVKGLQEAAKNQNGVEIPYDLSKFIEDTRLKIEELQKIFESGASGNLTLKMSQKTPSVVSIGMYLEDTLEILQSLYKNIGVLYNQAKTTMDNTQKDVRALMWECTYAFQTIREQHSNLLAMHEKYQAMFVNTDQSEISKPDRPNIEKPVEDNLDLQPNPPKEIPYEPDEIEKLKSKPNKYDKPKEQEMVTELPKTEEPKVTIVPQTTPKVVEKPKPSVLDTFEENVSNPWKTVNLGADIKTENDNEFLEKIRSLSDFDKKKYQKWLMDSKGPKSTILPLKGGGNMEITKDGSKVTQFRMVNVEYNKDQGEVLIK